MKLIAAVNSEWGIGANNQLLCHLPSDLRNFKSLTEHGVVIMGSNTWNSLPQKPLPNRVNIIVTRYPEKYDFAIHLSTIDGKFKELDTSIVYTACISDIIRLAASELTDQVWVIGGGELYSSLLPYCKSAVVTFIENAPSADTYIPNLYDHGFNIISESPKIEENGYQFTIKKLAR